MKTQKYLASSLGACPTIAYCMAVMSVPVFTIYCQDLANYLVPCSFIDVMATNHTLMKQNCTVLHDQRDGTARIEGAKAVGGVKMLLPIKHTLSNKHILPYHRE